MDQSLSRKDSLLFAPLSNVGAVSFDKDAVYIDIGRVNYTKKENLVENLDEKSLDDDSVEEVNDLDEPAGLLKNLQDVQSGVDEKLQKSSLRLFKKSKAVVAGSDDDSSVESSTRNTNERNKSLAEIDKLTMPFRQKSNNLEQNHSSSDESISSTDEACTSNFSDDDSDDSSSSEDDQDSDRDSNSDSDDSHNSDSTKSEDVTKNVASNSLWKTNLAQRAAAAYKGREASLSNLQEFVYGKSKSTIVTDDDGDDDDENSQSDSEDSSDDNFFKIKKKKLSAKSSHSHHNANSQMNYNLGEDDSSRFTSEGKIRDTADVSKWLAEGEGCLLESIRNKFVTGDWDSNDGSDGEKFDDFEDLETGEKFGPNGEIDSGDDESRDGLTDLEIREINSKKKMEKKNTFNKEYDDNQKDVAKESMTPGDDEAENEYLETLKKEKEARNKRNKEEFGEEGEASRIRHEGFRQGLYCRIRIDGIPCEFLDAFNPNLPLVLGGLTPQETNRGYIRCRFKKHRWHKKILKCNDPLIFSVGWRRFQSIPVFSTEDQNGRHR